MGWGKKLWNWLTEDAPLSPAPTRTYQLKEVFTPGRPANKGFVNRPQQESDFNSLLDDPGTQILVWGESGAGKSSLVSNVLKAREQEFITTRCTSTTTYDDILSSAFEQIGAMIRSSESTQETRSTSSGVEIGGSQSPVTISGNASFEGTRGDEYSRVVSAQLTAEMLAPRLGAKKLVWMIEDVHKVSAAERAKLADAMKVFSDESPRFEDLRIIILGVAETAGDILRAPSNMSGRLADVRIPPLRDDELGVLLDMAKELLNVDFSTVRSRIIAHSVGVASITHALARECCIALGIRETAATPIGVTHQALEQAKGAYSRTRSGVMKADFDKALEVTQTRKYHNYAIILRAIASLPERGATHAEIYARIRESHSEYPAGNLTQYLRKLQLPERSALIRKTSEGLFRYDQPLQHAYAILRFDLPVNSDWASGLTVTEEEKESAVRQAAEENLEAPEYDEDE
ncbi:MULTISPECIES: AAA family ATPase [unclassified Rathayibacter]|jgi:Cdc6-like AAA superfamily ATPase|uniref:AAA family ATPase n=1 Tax=unclassified Rathayibacter TaxID=2609250 RepID=UPI000CE89527|nr:MULTISPECIES: AAA family ATPase [unclassified Rathayibacter]PPF23788.1 hypothetical protein C5C54_17155 [Rathayibacter sp. AY1F2]PPH40882.1 hypothetical protein C5C42_17090 [Rathayibacter sp. AY1F7]